jgi:hypothetical protein
MTAADDRIDDYALANAYRIHAFTHAVDVAEELVANYPRIFGKRIVAVVNMHI